MAQDADPEEDSEAESAAGGRDSPLLSQLSARSTRVAARHSWAEGGRTRRGGGSVVSRTATGLRRTHAIEDFPAAGQTTIVEWQESQQNFVVTAVE